MASFKIVARHFRGFEHRPLPVRIRLTHLRKSVYIKTPFYVFGKQIDPITYEILDQKVVASAMVTVQAYQDALLKIGVKAERMTVEELCEAMDEIIGKKGGIDLVAFGRAMVEDFQSDGREGNASIYTTALNRFSEYAGKTVNTTDITKELLKNWERWLKKDGVKEAGVNLYMRTIRAIFNAARAKYNDEDTGTITIRNYPFGKYKIQSAPTPKKRNLTIEHIQAIIDSTPQSNREQVGRDVFLLSFFLLGMNIVDLWGNNCRIIGDRLIYNRTKTKNRRKDNAHISVKIEPEAKELIEKYRDPAGNRLFVFYQTYNNRMNFARGVNVGLKSLIRRINQSREDKVPHTTTYYARHSVGTLMWKCGVDMETISQALGHAGGGGVTEFYVEKDYSRVDKANRKVLDLLH